MYLNNTLFRTAQLWPNRIAIDTGDATRSWAQTLDRTRRLASGLKQLAAPDGRVALLGVNSGEFVELTLAVPLAGLPMVTINYRLTAEEVLHMYSECPWAVLCFDASTRALAERLQPLVQAKFVYWGSEADRPGFALAYEQLIAGHAPCLAPQNSPSDVWAIIPSGGTTGLPKSIELSHRAMAFTVASTLNLVDLGDAPCGLHVAPLFHLAGFTANYALTATGGTHAFLGAFSVDGLLAALTRHRCTMTNLVPTMISWLMAREDLDQFDLSALRNILYGASSISPALLRRVLTVFPSLQLNQFYGQTEACGALTCLLPGDHSLAPEHVHRLRSAGRPLPGTHVEILDEQGQIMPRGTAGEISGRTEALFNRYLGHPEMTMQAVRDGWLRTGDIGYMDDDGYLYVTDRLKDMIVTGGENVSASEVENVLAKIPGVIQVAVVAAPDEVWGESVHAFVVTGAGDAPDRSRLDEVCRRELALYKIPRRYTIQTDSLPLSGAGKIRKDLLRAGLRAAVGQDQPAL